VHNSHLFLLPSIYKTEKNQKSLHANRIFSLLHKKIAVICAKPLIFPIKKSTVKIPERNAEFDTLAPKSAVSSKSRLNICGLVASKNLLLGVLL